MDTSYGGWVVASTGQALLGSGWGGSVAEVVYPCRSEPTSGARGVIASDYLSYDRSSVCP